MLTRKRTVKIKLGLNSLLLKAKGVLGFPGGAVVKNLPASAGDARDAAWIFGSGRSPQVESGTPLQYSCLENSMGRGAWLATVHGAAELDMTKHTHTHTHTHTYVHTKEFYDHHYYFCQQGHQDFTDLLHGRYYLINHHIGVFWESLVNSSTQLTFHLVSLMPIMPSARSKHILKLTVDRTCSPALRHNLWAE